ncbi:MAG: hypothetical protein QOC94_4721, partial [Actinoplanes sp.]|nr:hypothetical protein [Actinoplanes sp.]
MSVSTHVNARSEQEQPGCREIPAPSPGRKHRGVLSTVAASAVVFLALVFPDQLGRYHPGLFWPGAFLRLPIEGILGAAILIVLPVRWRRPVAIPLGLGLAVLTILKVINIGFLNVLSRRFDPVLDWPLFGDGYNALTETDGKATADAAVAGALALAAVLLTVITLAVLRLARVTPRYRRPASATVTAASAVWVVFALFGTELYPGAPVAADSTAATAKLTALGIPGAIRDRQQFTAEARQDAFAGVPADQLLTGLRGHDMVIGVVESYGRSVLQNPRMAQIVDPALAAGTRQLTAAGFAAKSGFLTSSTYGGGSWLAHGSFQSGLWIDNQSRYRQLISGNRLTLTNAFHKAGWNTVGVEPGNTRAWPEADFYGYDKVFDSRNLGYAGPRFGWSNMPDQYTIKSFQDQVYAKKTGPLMAEITMTSSHEPWTPVPQMVDWNSIGDGSGFAPQALVGKKRSVLWKDPAQTQAEYAKSIAYSVQTLTSWATTYGDDNLVMVFFGDHQPIPLVSGQGSSHDVPITIVAKDPKVLDRIASWGWQDGLKPDPQAPVWRMDQFRDKFLTAFA